MHCLWTGFENSVFYLLKSFFIGMREDLGLYLPKILKNVLGHVLQIFIHLYSEAFECNTTSNWLNRMV